MRAKLRDPKLIALALIGAVALGSYAIAPAIGGGLFTAKKAKKLFPTKAEVYTKAEADQAFYTRAQANQAFTPAGSSFTKSEADGRYVAQSGQTRLSIGPQDWVVRTGSLTADYESGNVGFSHSAGGVLADQFFSLGLDLPTTLQGVPQRFGSIEVCYGNDPNTALDRVLVGLQAATPAAPDPGETFVIDNPWNFVDDNCRTFSPASPVAIGANDYGALTIGVDYSDNGTFVLFRTTVNLLPQ